MSHRLLQQFGGLEGLLAAPSEILLDCHGLGVAKAALLKAVYELMKRSDETQLAQPQPLSDANVVARYVRRRIAHCRREVFGCLFMDTRHRPISWEILFTGTLNRAHVYSREILKRGIDLDAAAIVLAHNHPSGVAEPSHADIALTRELRDLLARIDIVVLDHIIVAPGSSAVSLATRGLMGATNPSCSEGAPVV
jgi:DNA repair protein RadC